MDLAKKVIQTSIFWYIRTITNRFDTQLIAKKLILEIDYQFYAIAVEHIVDLSEI